MGLATRGGASPCTSLKLLKKNALSGCIWENVAGVLHSNKGRDFGALLGAVEDIGYRFAWRVLDAQYFGVPQRRRRIFLVGHRRSWRCACKVLFDTWDMPWTEAEAKKTGKKDRPRVAACLRAGYSRSFNDAFATENLINGFDNTIYGSKPPPDPRPRKLMPLECERIMGFDNGYTNIPGASDAKRYKALGNSIVVPVLRWIASRIETVS